MTLTTQDWQEWASNPVTQAFYSDLKASRASRVEGWVVGNYTEDTADKTVMLNAKALGSVEILDQIIDVLDSAKKGMRNV